jgi:eukaryotic-like serine/threonine-protein kinase
MRPAAWEEGSTRYAVDALLGRGGMGEVRLALDRRIGREVALKTVRQGESPSDAEHVVERFLWEACIQGQLEHPSIVPVYDLERSDSGELYFTMKRVRGRTLRSILDALRNGDVQTDTAYPPRKMLAAFQSVCLAVAFAHSRGIVHRDLKPENIMLGDYGEVYVLDWGIAKVIGEREATSPSVRPPAERTDTVAGSILGTLGYMAPEQLRSNDSVDDRADIYALGAILFEILTLERLHPGEADAIVKSMAAGVDARARLRELERDLPIELENACALATGSKKDRCASARELHDHVERYLSHHRSVELRREMSRKHSTAAAEAAARTLAARDAHGDRRQALQEAGRALALDPSNEHAADTIMKLLVTPPEEQPTEVRRQLDDKHLARGLQSMRVASVSFASLLLYVPFLMWMGIESWTLLAAMTACITAVVALAFFFSRRKRLTDRTLLLAYCGNMLVVGATALVMGPFVITPGFAAAVALVTAVYFERHRAAIIILGWASIIVPLVLERVGVLPASYAFVEGGMLIKERMVALHEAPTLILLIVASFTTLTISAVAGAQIRGSLSEAERRLSVQAWQLGQLVPTTHERESENPVRPIVSNRPPGERSSLATADTIVDTAQTCPREEEILDMVHGKSTGEARRRMEEHIDSCDSCRELVSLVAQQRD